jgi:Flp pilus assembly protein TadG
VPGSKGRYMRVFRRGESGASAVEFAVILPLLVVLVFGIIAFGFGFARWVALTNGAREGARYMAINSAGDPNAEAQAITRAQQWANLPCAGGGCTYASTSYGPAVQDASFSITMPEFSPFDVPFIPGLGFPLTSTAVMQCGG